MFLLFSTLQLASRRCEAINHVHLSSRIAESLQSSYEGHASKRIITVAALVLLSGQMRGSRICLWLKASLWYRQTLACDRGYVVNKQNNRARQVLPPAGGVSDKNVKPEEVWAKISQNETL